MNEDISKNTLLVLVVLTIIISLLGTWTVINEATKLSTSGAATRPVQSVDSTVGKVSIDIEKPIEPVQTTGQVILTITNA